jgi:predicted ATP-binding protein involved in virulence
MSKTPRGALMQSDSIYRRVVRISVDGLFGLYNHNILLHTDERLTIIHGPNGAGKTVMLKLTYAMLSGNVFDLAAYPYKSFSVYFNDGSEVTSVNQNTKARDKKRQTSISLTSKSSSGEVHKIELDNTALHRAANQIERNSPIHQISENQWMDSPTEEIINAIEVIKRYGGHQQGENLNNLMKKSGIDFLQRLQTTHGVHLIEAQRLIKLNEYSVEEPIYLRKRAMSSTETVVEYSNDLRKKIETTLADYAKRSQQLDQSFPQRLLTTNSEAMSDVAISLGMKEIQDKQFTYQSLGLINKATAGTYPFDSAQAEGLDDAKKAVMAVYVRDTKEKFAVLDDLAGRVNLLLKNINAKFRNKEIVVSRERGLTVKTPSSDELPISALSSGEQHEIVLMYDLLFRIKPNTLVMIDEPELSLHVNWQERFLSDLSEVIKVAGFDALIATHSPYIISDRSDLLVELSTEVQEFERV